MAIVGSCSKISALQGSDYSLHFAKNLATVVSQPFLRIKNKLIAEFIIA